MGVFSSCFNTLLPKLNDIAFFDIIAVYLYMQKNTVTHNSFLARIRRSSWGNWLARLNMVIIDRHYTLIRYQCTLLLGNIEYNLTRWRMWWYLGMPNNCSINCWNKQCRCTNYFDLPHPVDVYFSRGIVNEYTCMYLYFHHLRIGKREVQAAFLRWWSV